MKVGIGSSLATFKNIVAKALAEILLRMAPINICVVPPYEELLGSSRLQKKMMLMENTRRAHML